MTKQAWLLAVALLVVFALWHRARSSDPEPAPAGGLHAAALTETPTDRSSLAPPAELSGGVERRVGAEVHRSSIPETGSVNVVVVGALSIAAEAGAELPEPLAPDIPLAGLTVDLWPGHGEEPPLIGRRHVQQTGEDGHARFLGLEAGPYTVDVVARPADPLGGAQQPRFVEVSAGGEVRLDVALPIAVLAKGRVVDAAGAPVAGADIWAGDDVLEQQALPQHLLRRVAQSRKDGTFSPNQIQN